MKKITLFVCSLFVALFATARVVEVPTSADYPTMYAAAMDGDTLLLMSGNYANQALPAMKAITVMAPDTCEVYLTGQIGGGDSNEGGSIFFEHVAIGSSSYLISYGSEGAMKTISFKNCLIYDISRCLINNGGDATKSSLENLILEGCTVRNCNTGNWNQLYTNVPIYNITYNECTFYGNDGVESFYSPRSSSDESHNFTFTHNTVYQGARDTGRYIANIGNKFSGENCTATFENNLIICPDGKKAGGLLNITGGYWTVSVKNNLVVGYAMPVDSILTEVYGWDYACENNYTLEELGMTMGQIFADPVNGDFTVYTVSVLNGKANDGGVLGATKWLVDGGVLYTLTQGLAEGVDAAAGSVSGPSGVVAEGKEITLTAVKNYGFKFVKWVDATGATLSEEAVYTFTMDSDKNIYAVFEAIPMYKLTINVAGSGTYTISEAGQNGEYTYFEEGTELILTAVTNTITDFVMWTNGVDLFDGSLNYTVVMTQDIELTAEFARKSFVCGWEFDTSRNDASQNREADYLSDNYNTENGTPLWSMYYTKVSNDEPHAYGWWNRTESNRFAATPWKRFTAVGDQTEYKLPDGKMDSASYFYSEAFYYKTAISTKYYKDIAVSYAIKTSYCGFDTWELDYSYNGLSWETVAKHDVNSGWQVFCDTIANTAGKDLVYLRLTADVTSNQHGNIFDVDGTYIADIYVLADADGTKPNGIQNVKAEPVVMVREGELEVTGLEGVNEVCLYGADGRLVRSNAETSNFVWNTVGMQKGMYILKVAGKASKILVK